MWPAAVVGKRGYPAAIHQDAHFATLKAQGGEHMVTGKLVMHPVINQNLILGFIAAAHQYLAVAEHLRVGWRTRQLHCRLGTARIEQCLQTLLGAGLVPLPLTESNEQRDEHKRNQRGQQPWPEAQG